MNDDLTKKLREKYPEFFSEDWRFVYGDGWYEIIDRMCEALTSDVSTFLELDEVYAKDFDEEFTTVATDGTTKYQIEVKRPQVVAAHTKEKLGTLRVYYDLKYEPRFEQLAYGESALPEARRIADCYDYYIMGIVQMAGVLSSYISCLPKNR